MNDQNNNCIGLCGDGVVVLDEECDDNNDGLLTVDLNQQTASILNGQNPNEFEVTYFITEVDAIENTNHLEVQYTATNNEIIYFEQINTKIEHHYDLKSNRYKNKIFDETLMKFHHYPHLRSSLL